MIDPKEGFHWLLKKLPISSLNLRLDFDLFSRPHYAYCIYQACYIAQKLSLTKISAIEFGVAGGNGLKAIEAIVEEIEIATGVEVEIYGFDSGKGLPKPEDPRDLPYIWQQGFFAMDENALRQTLKKSALVLGDVKDTVADFVTKYQPAPIGAVFHDLDYYSSTVAALKLFECENKYLLPRVFCYFDDIMSSNIGIISESVGQLCAIKEYSQQHDNRKLEKVNGLNYIRYFPSRWNDQIFVLHCFDHPLYSNYIHPDLDRQLKLQSCGAWLIVNS
ncbi:MAG: hypothetical protein DSM107014_13100 [Gomphosphaeria aponina SAG 52.96 = DSM 107014]|uniref:Uncharacterized protein n=1 Tax=Gomphosphaeria aponina SAG 52.96 = DSM 107014 TaxID=1521640 RepID=A0A941GS53_9CHRO|nr:hypothetical protein [Gomphosphaeria aponina SAG 52.96 = DSM 107014]